MKYVCEFNMCSSCKACIDICKKDAIYIVDNITACNAVIEESKCINCGMCEMVCPNNHPPIKKAPIDWKQGWALDADIRQNSSSGGAAAAIQHGFVEAGGIVCSCCFGDNIFGFDFASKTSDLYKFIGSKYVKSDPFNIYERIKILLRENQKVLFIGLPCQCAALKKYTKDNGLLYTIDLICHGTPSPKLLHRFLREKGYPIEETRNLKFRDKTDWRLSYGDKTIEPKSVRDSYMIAFLKAICYTENCYSCQYASIERVSDLTLGDSWGSKLDEGEQSKGISLILCQTDKGQKLLEMARLHLLDVDLSTAIKNNRQLSEPSKKPDNYELFFRELKKSNRIDKAVRKCYPKIYARQRIKAFLIKSGLINR